jgi:hypothetical protein
MSDGPTSRRDVRARRHVGQHRWREGEPKPPQTSMRKIMARVVPRTIMARLDGSYRKTPFFDVGTGRAIAEPRLVAPEERARLAGLAGI